MQMFRSTMKLDADTASRIGEDFWQKWKETVADVAETTRQAAVARTVADIWSAQVNFGMRNAQRWSQWQPCVTVAADLAARPAAAAPASPPPRAMPALPVKAEVKPVEIAPAAVSVQPAPVPEAAPVPKAAAEPAMASVTAAPPAESDDLTRIRGIGPAIERKLREHGLTTFRQIAALSDADRAALDDALDFKGRIERDEWVAQARKLSERGNAEGSPGTA